MLETAATIGIALAAGFATITTRLYGRIQELDKRVDSVELRIAEKYVSKKDLSDMITRMEGHMVRIEEKLDRITIRSHSQL